VEGIGLPQYRKKFMHHCISGRLLLRLNDELLKKEMGIGPLVSSSLCGTANPGARAALKHDCRIWHCRAVKQLGRSAGIQVGL
jgi:hypothetical protein